MKRLLDGLFVLAILRLVWVFVGPAHVDLARAMGWSGLMLILAVAAGARR